MLPKPNKKKPEGKSLKELAIKKQESSPTHTSSCKGKYKLHVDSPDQ